jgi:sugar lactone lactonase YvrE
MRGTLLESFERDHTVQAELLYNAQAELAEGPVWHEDRLYWVNITAGTLNCLDPTTGVNTARSAGQMLGAAVPCSNGHWLLALHHGLAFYDPASDELHPIADPESHLPRNRFNDGKCDPAGRFWAGTMNMDGRENSAALYRLDSDISVHKVLPEISISNGMAWSHDGGTFYYIDTPTRTIQAFDYEPATAAITRRRRLVAIPQSQGYPDGMTIDQRGNLWVGLWGGHAVICCDGRSGEVLERINTPVSQPSSCTFGGTNYQTLYITSAWRGLGSEQRKKESLAGAIFSVKPGVSGRPAVPFLINPRGNA